MELSSVLTPEIDQATSSERVYVVDDDPLVLSAIRDALASRGYQPSIFDNAADLLASINPLESGCIVTDLQMPGMDGVALQQALVDRGSLMSLIMLTAYADVPVAVKVMSQGAAMLLEKPFKVDRLISEVKRALEVSAERHANAKRISQAREAMAMLTSEEIAVMDCAVQGLSNKATGNDLSLSSRTVDRRRQSALKKLGAGSVSEYAVIRQTAKDALANEG